MYNIYQLSPADLKLTGELLTVFGAAFDDEQTYTSKPPSACYLRQLLGSDYFIALAALNEQAVVGGLIAYELKKFEQERSEIYIYDLAVAENRRRHRHRHRLN